MPSSTAARASRGPATADEIARCAVLYPAIAEAARRMSAQAVGLIDVGFPTGLNVNVDGVGITYSNGQSLGDPSSPVRVSATVVGDRPIPQRAMPEVVARIGVDLDLVDAADPDPEASALARVPADALPVITTTWALSRVSLEGRLRFLHRLVDAAADRTVMWVSAEGVGVAPAIPTLGDRRRSGHSIIGLAAFDRSSIRAEAIGRCWSRGRWLAWLADS